MLIAEYCSNCDKKTMRQTEPCPGCTPKSKESPKTTLNNRIPKLPSLEVICRKVGIVQREKQGPAENLVNEVYGIIDRHLRHAGPPL